MKVHRVGNAYRRSFQGGPRHVLLGLVPGSLDPAEAPVVELPRAGTCDHGPLDPDRIRVEVAKALSEVLAKTGNRVRLATIEYVPNDSPYYEMYYGHALAIAQAITADQGAFALSPKILVDRVVAAAPALGPVLDEHLEDGELLPHVFFCDVTRFVVSGFSDRPEQRADAEKILALLEEAMGSPAENVQNLVSVSFCENLLGEKPLEAIRAAMGPRLRAELAHYEHPTPPEVVSVLQRLRDERVTLDARGCDEAEASTVALRMTPWMAFLADLGVLLDAWDPIGVYAEPANGPPPGEYDDVIPRLAQMCVEGWPEGRIAQAMHRWVEESCGIGSDAAKDLALARAASALWKRSGEPRPLSWTDTAGSAGGGRGLLAHPLEILKRVEQHAWDGGVVDPTGWLPGGAAKPRPVRVGPVTLEVEIGAWEGGYLLLYRAKEDDRVHGVTWFGSLEEAEKAARTRFGVNFGEGRAP